MPVRSRRRTGPPAPAARPRRRSRLPAALLELRGRRGRRRASAWRREHAPSAPPTPGQAAAVRQACPGVRRRAPRRGRFSRPPVRGGGAGTHPTAVRSSPEALAPVRRTPWPGSWPRPTRWPTSGGLAPGGARRPHRQGRRPDGRGGGGTGGGARGRGPPGSRGGRAASAPSAVHHPPAAAVPDADVVPSRPHGSARPRPRHGRRDLHGVAAPAGPPARRRAAGGTRGPGGRPVPADQHRGRHRHGRPGRSGARPRTRCGRSVGGPGHRAAARPPVRHRIGHRRAGPGRPRRRHDAVLDRLAAGDPRVHWVRPDDGRDWRRCGHSWAGRPARWSRRPSPGRGPRRWRRPDASRCWPPSAAVRSDSRSGRAGSASTSTDSCRRRWPEAAPGSAHR